MVVRVLCCRERRTQHHNPVPYPSFIMDEFGNDDDISYISFADDTRKDNDE